MRKCKHFDYKKFLSKKVVWGIVVVMIASFITIPKIITRANNYQTIKVLEVEPGNGFVLADNTTDDANQMNVVVTKVDMPTFISMVDDIDGKYDVVYIGRYGYSKDNVKLNGCWDTDTADIYRDYSAPFKYPRVDDTSGGTEKTILQGDNLGTNIVDRLQAQAYWYGTLGLSTGDPIKKDAAYNLSQTWNTQAQNGNVTTKINGVTKQVKEYYSENDITKRRANEVIKMIKSNQLVYVNNGVFNSDLNGTNLKSIFNSSDLTSYSNYQKVDNLNNNQIIQYYAKNLVNTLKRPTVTNVIGPKSDDWNALVTDTLDQKIAKRKDNRNMSFSFDLTKPDQSTQYQAKLYLDFNADGMFEDNEVVPISNVDPRTYINLNSGTNTINYTLRNDFVGYLDWKIEVYNSSSPNVKTNVYGNSIYKRTGDKVNINVLQLVSSDAQYPNNLDLTSTDASSNFYKSVSNPAVTDDYNIKIIKETVPTFNNDCANLNITDPNDVATQNFIKSYDMIIFGFADCYGNVSANNFSDKSISILKMFNDKHKSMMFTHDSISLNALGNSIVSMTTDKTKTYSFNNSGNKLTQYFRDIVGQSRYTDPYNNNSSIIHDPSDNDNTSLNTITLGATAYASPTLYDRSMVAPNTCSTVRLINKGDINSYPFNLSSYDSNNMLVERTHVQWYQINLEDPEVVPWYNLSTGNLSSNSKGIYFNTGDSRNFYYTYSRGNITFSGTGHTSSTTAVGGYTNEESQLFVNTIIKAIRGANVPPVVTNYSADKTSEYINNSTIKINASQPFSFYSMIYDQDGKDGDNIPVKITTDDNKTLFDGILQYKIGGVYTDQIPIDSAYLISRIGQTIKVTVSATDVYGTKDTKTFSIQVDPSPIQIYHSTVKPTAQTTGAVWNPSNIDNIVDVQGLTKDYYTVVPFVTYISMFNTGANLTLTLDSKFSGAYSDSDYLVPTVYAVNNGSLKYLGIMTSTDNINYTYTLDKNIVGSNATIDSNGNCDIVIRYNCKTYNHNTDSGSLQYQNNITVSRAGLPDSSQNASINVGFKPLNGTLY